MSLILLVLVERDDAFRWECALRESKFLPERSPDEAFEHPVHVHQESRRPHPAPAGLDRCVSQNEPRKTDDFAVVLVQAVEGHVGYGLRWEVRPA